MRFSKFFAFCGFVATMNGCSADSTVDYCSLEDATEVPSDWVFIEGESFEMGSLGEHEGPIHTVTVPSFQMWRTEVTVAQYARCWCSNECQQASTADEASTWSRPDREDHPVNMVSWEYASNFCSWVGGRLPSEAEWEFAARSGGQDIKYPWGDDMASCDLAVMWDGESGCGENHTWPVCSKPDGNTDQGLCDMSGNVKELVQDTYHENYEGAPTDGSAWESWEDYRVMRNGAYDGQAADMRAARRESGGIGGLVGFRCAK